MSSCGERERVYEEEEGRGRNGGKKGRKKAALKIITLFLVNLTATPIFPSADQGGPPHFIRNMKHTTLKISAAKALSNWKKIYRLKNS